MTALDLDDVARCGAPACPRLPVCGHLCRVHGDQVGQWLAEILDDWRELDAAPDSRPRPGGDAAGGRQSTKVKSKSTPVNLDAVAIADRRIAWLTDDDLVDLVDVAGYDATPRALEVLAWWAGIVRAEFGIAYPTRQTYLAAGPPCAARCWHLECAAARDVVVVSWPLPLTVEGERQMLADHLRWCLRQPWAGQLWRSIRGLWSALKEARGDDSGRPVAVCRRVVDPVTFEVCGGRVYSERGAGWCGRCAHTWSGRELLELTRKGVAA